MKLDKKQNRLRRARRGRAKIRELEANRLSIHRTPRHIYAQVIGPDGAKVLASASTLEAEVRKGIKNGGNVEAAAIVGARIAEKVQNRKILQSRYSYPYYARRDARFHEGIWLWWFYHP